MLTARQEKFALGLFEGLSKCDAWARAGYSTNYSREVMAVNASRMAAKTQVKLRVAELRAIPAKRPIMTFDQRRCRLSEIAQANLRDHVSNDEISVEGPNPGAVAEYTCTPGRYGRRKAIKLRDPVSAIAELNKMDGVYDTPVAPPAVVQTFVFVLPDGTRLLPGQIGTSQNTHYAKLASRQEDVEK